MADVNLSNIRSMYYLSRAANLTNVFSNVLINLPDSSLFFKVNSIILNNDSISSSNVFIRHVNSTSTYTSDLYSKLLIPGNNVTYLTNKNREIFLNESESLQANTDDTKGLKIILNYEYMSSNIRHPSANYTVACYVAVAGGGAGGMGGGGGGGFIEGTTLLDLNQRYCIVVGAGGAAFCCPAAYCVCAGGNGTPSCISSFLIAYGGGGGQGSGTTGADVARGGGSGGGSVYPYTGPPPGSGNEPRSNPVQGYPGGQGVGQGGAYALYGGGGGANMGGDCPASKTASKGGNGRMSNLLGVYCWFGGGGGGGGFGTDHYVPSALGGLGGGGCGGWPNPSCQGNVNTGGGGGAAGIPNPSISCGAPGGSGTVFISYPFSVRAATNVTGNVYVDNIGSQRVYRFLSSGSITI